MAEFNNTTNATYFKPSTDGLVMFNDENMMLKIAYYDVFMKIELREKNSEGKYPAPELGKDISILLAEDKVCTLKCMLDEFEAKFIEYNNDFADGKDCSEYKPYSIAIHTGSTPEKTRVLQISTGTVTERGFIPIIYIHVGTDANLVATKTYAFQTKLTSCLYNYDATAGTVDMKYKCGQYEVVSMAIRTFAALNGKAIAHLSKTYTNDENLRKMEKLVNMLAENFNIHLEPAGGKFRSNSPFDSFGANTVATQPPVIENGGDLGTLLGTANFK